MKTMLLTEAIRQGIITVGDANKGIVGDYVDYPTELESYTPRLGRTGGYREETLRTEQLDWRIEKVGDEIFLVPDRPITHDIWLRGITGYDHGWDELMFCAQKLYSNPIAWSVSLVSEDMVKEGISNCSLEYIVGEKIFGKYRPDGDEYAGMISVKDGVLIKKENNALCSKNSYGIRSSFGSIPCNFRPIVSLKSGLHVFVYKKKHYGSKENPWAILESGRAPLRPVRAQRIFWKERRKLLGK